MFILYSNGERKDIGGFNRETAHKIEIEHHEARRVHTRVPYPSYMVRVPVALLVDSWEYYGIQADFDPNQAPEVRERVLYRGLPLIVLR